MSLKEDLQATVSRLQDIIAELPDDPPAPPTPTDTIINVKAGDNLQNALNAAANDKSGRDVIVKISPKATFNAALNLPPKVHNQLIYVQPDFDIPANLGPHAVADNPDLPRLVTNNTGLSTLTSLASKGWVFIGMNFPYTGNAAKSHVYLGDANEADPLKVARNIMFSQCFFRGSPTQFQRRAIVANCGMTTMDRCTTRDIGYIGQDGQSFACWNGSGPFQLTGNDLEAAGENFLFGGGMVRSAAMVPSDIFIEGNRFSKNPAWLKLATQPTVKNLGELKCAQRVKINGNLFENSWTAGQVGYALLLKAASGGETTPLVRCHHVQVSNNIMRRAGVFLSINNSEGPTPTLGCDDIEIVNNLGYELGLNSFVNASGAPVKTGSGAAFRFGGGPDNVRILHNTLLNLRAFIEVWAPGDVMPGFQCIGNLAREADYAVKGDSQAAGLGSINTYMPGSTFAYNAFENGNAAAGYPANNTILNTGMFNTGFDAQFRPTAPQILALKDSAGKVVGAEIDVILSIFKNYGLSL